MYEHQTTMVACTVCYLCGYIAKFIGHQFPRKKTNISGAKHLFSIACSIARLMWCYCDVWLGFRKQEVKKTQTDFLNPVYRFSTFETQMSRFVIYHKLLCLVTHLYIFLEFPPPLLFETPEYLDWYFAKLNQR